MSTSTLAISKSFNSSCRHFGSHTQPCGFRARRWSTEGHSDSGIPGSLSDCIGCGPGRHMPRCYSCTALSITGSGSDIYAKPSGFLFTYTLLSLVVGYHFPLTMGSLPGRLAGLRGECSSSSSSAGAVISGPISLHSNPMTSRCRRLGYRVRPFSRRVQTPMSAC